MTAPMDSARIARMQSYEDAVCWRTGKLAEPCANCDASTEVWCDDHAIDLHLIAGYKLALNRLARTGES
jgi:hypothetical protein